MGVLFYPQRVITMSAGNLIAGISHLCNEERTYENQNVADEKNEQSE